MMTMPDAYDRAVAQRIQSLESQLSAAVRRAETAEALTDRCIADLAVRDGVSTEEMRFRMTGRA